MPKKSLKAQLNQIRAWVRQGRTDAWIAHQLEVPASELREFRRRHELTADGDGDGDEVDLRDEIEAEIEAATLEEDDEPDEDEDEDEDPDEDADRTGEGEDSSDDEGSAGEDGGDRGGAPKRRRRRGRRGRGAQKKLEATFDHGDDDGYGLWLDPALADNPVYAEHWAGHRAVEVQIEPDRITIRRS